MLPGEKPCFSEKVKEGDENTQIRISEKLQTLHSQIPNETKMDKISILEGALEYLKSIHEESEQIEKELSQRSDTGSSSENQGRYILKVEVEKLVEGRFVVRITWRGKGFAGDVQRIIECLDVKMTSISVNDKNPDEMLTTAFVKIKKHMKMSEEKLHDLIMSAAR